LAAREDRVSAAADGDPGPAGAPGALAWSVWPARERPWAALVLILSVAVLGVLIARGTGDRVLGVAAPLFLLGSLGSFLAKTEYRLTRDAAEARTLGVVRARPWGEMRRATADRSGVFLSPFETRTWLESYRGMRLLFGGNRDQVVAFVEARLGKPVEGGAVPEAGRKARAARGRAGPDRS
jgi:hypothetical protein